MLKKILSQSVSLGSSVTARHIYWVFSGNILGIILTFVTLILVLANHLSKEEYGIFLSLFTLASLLSELGEAGLGSSLSRFIPPLRLANKETEARHFLSTAFYAELIIGLVITIIMLITAPVLSRALFASTPLVNVVVTSFMTLSMVLFGFAILSLSSYKLFSSVSLVTIFYNVVRLGILIIFYVLGKLTLPTILVAYTISGLLSWLFSLVFLKSNFLKYLGDWQKFTTIIKFSSFLALQKVFVAVSSRLDMLMLVPFSNPIEASIYGVASRFSLVYPVFIGSLAQVLAPKFSGFSQTRDALKFLKKVSLIIILLLITLILFYVFAYPMIYILVPKYVEAVPVFRTLLIAMSGFVLATPFTSFLTFTLKKPQITSFASFVQLLIIFWANLYFIPLYGRFGPIIGIGFGNLVVLIISAIACWYYINKV